MGATVISMYEPGQRVAFVSNCCNGMELRFSGTISMKEWSFWFGWLYRIDVNLPTRKPGGKSAFDNIKERNILGLV